MPTKPHSQTSRRRRRAYSTAHAPIERIFRMHVLINQGERVTAPVIADEFDVDERTILRDIKFMQKRLGVPIEYHSKWVSYYYTRPCPALPLLRLTPHDLAVLTMVRNTFAAWAGVSIAGLLRGVFKKFVAVGGPSMALPDARGEGDFAPITEFAQREQENLAAIWEAMVRRRELRIIYRKPRSTVNETRTIQPLHVDCPGRRWIVIARDLKRADYRTFRLGRIRAMRPTGERFKVPADFNAAELLSGNMGAYTGREAHEVRVALRGAAETFAEEEGLHRSQKLSRLPDGRLVATLQLNNLVEIVNEILRWGPEAEVLSPPKLRDAVRDAHQAGAAVYV